MPRRPGCDCGERAVPIQGVSRTGADYRAWACAYWPSSRCRFSKFRKRSVPRDERGAWLNQIITEKF